MACCVAAGLLIAFVRRQWFRLLGRAPEQAAFAPPARREAPTTTTVRKA